MTEEELKVMLTCDESFRIERTVSTSNMDKFQEAICAFANDLPGSRKKGYLLIGVNDDGSLSGLSVGDSLMKKISGIRSDGNILPLPLMNTEKVSTANGDVLVVEVTPSFDTPVRYRGRTFVRIGPRRDIASSEEERILTERCTASLPTFDVTPCREATINDIDTEAIISQYLPQAIDKESLANDYRELKEQMASLRLYNMKFDCPTMAAIILFGKNPRYFFPGDYVQFVRFAGNNKAGEILNEREFKGNLITMLPRLESFVGDAVVTRRPVPVSILREKTVTNYPYLAVRELLMNAVMHRDYQSNTPIRLYQFDDRIEIMNAGGLYGEARPENFPNVNAYRNPVVAEAMKVLKYVNMFNRGITRVQELLSENASEKAKFSVNKLTVFEVTIEDANVTDLRRACDELATQVDSNSKVLIISMKDNTLSLSELMLATELATKSRKYFVDYYLNPAIKHGYIKMLYPNNPHHPYQKYYLTNDGINIYKHLKDEAKS
jgi:ATP-dependent DNA helicase RecG